MTALLRISGTPRVPAALRWVRSTFFLRGCDLPERIPLCGCDLSERNPLRTCDPPERIPLRACDPQQERTAQKSLRRFGGGF